MSFHARSTRHRSANLVNEFIRYTREHQQAITAGFDSRRAMGIRVQ
jgi:hypothetical protein